MLAIFQPITFFNIFIIKQAYMLKPARRNFDNVSIAHTKSSKTMKSKLNNNPEVEVKTFEPPYFKEDIVRKEIEERAKKENEKSDGLYHKPREDHLGKAGRIVEDLMKKHKETKEKLHKMKQDAERKTEIQCPFKPERKKIDKFIVGGNVIRRNEIWLQEKKRKQLERKEEVLLQDLSQCTFSPQLASKKQSEVYLKNRSQSKSALSKKKESVTFESSKAISPIRQKRDISSNQFLSAKREINNRLLNMNDK